MEASTILKVGNREYKAFALTIAHALRPLAIDHIDMPATPDRIRQAIHERNFTKAAVE
jgi:hypothetical protein